MIYSNVFIESISYELGPHIITSESLEDRLAFVYKKLHINRGQFEALTGIKERRFWDTDCQLHECAIQIGKKALEESIIEPHKIGMLLYAGVCKTFREPAMAYLIADALNIPDCANMYDITNACLGVINGIIQIANAIELGQIKAGMVIACESSREVIDLTIDKLLETPNMELFKNTFVNLTGGSGAIAVLLTDKVLNTTRHRLLGGAARNASKYNDLCVWHCETDGNQFKPELVETDPAKVLYNGVILGQETFKDFKKNLNMTSNQPHKVVCHQCGAVHQKKILETLCIPHERDFSTYTYLGNIGPVSLPISAAIAESRGFFDAGDLVAFLGIGSGLNCLMLGVEW